uniref:Peptidase_M13_N domain-containing protein n=1 Tax=Steinernema glaseri TaxID=37863 RepID=A0A1I7ZRI5_9BILA
MDFLPLCFVKSVLRNFEAKLLNNLKPLSGLWGEVGETYAKKCGSLYLAHSPYYEEDQRIYYDIHGFYHMEITTLSREVVREMSKSITSIEFDMIYHTGREAIINEWDSIDPNDDELIQLLTNLDAPTKKLLLKHPVEFMTKEQLSWYTAKIPKYYRFLRSFTSVSLHPAIPLFEALLKDMISTTKLQKVYAIGPASQTIPNSTWVNYFFSASCMKLGIYSKDVDLVLSLIGQWKQTDPRSLVRKNFEMSRIVPDDIINVGLKQIPLEPNYLEILEKVERGITKHDPYIKTAYRIDHPVDSNRGIYAVFFQWGGLCMLLMD